MSDTTVSIPTRMLVLGMARENGSIHADELYDVAEACGQSAEQVRSCLRRLVADGDFVRQGTGREAVYEPTERGGVFLAAPFERTRRAYAQDAQGRGWDRYWRLVAFAVPEERRAVRDTFRQVLVALGGSAVQGGLYVSPHPWHPEVRAEAERLGIADLVSFASTDDLAIGDTNHPTEIAGRLWPVAHLAHRYQGLVDAFTPVVRHLEEMRTRHERLPETVFLPGALALTVAFTEVFDDDPLLPPELLPHPWPGREARELAREARRLAFAQREQPMRPGLFRFFDQALEGIA
ncbi:MAG: transcriptional regulator [Actinobacteria bacterium]|nr:transcriptional regulator [Actinomycetota bacterium]